MIYHNDLSTNDLSHQMIYKMEIIPFSFQKTEFFVKIRNFRAYISAHGTLANTSFEFNSFQSKHFSSPKKILICFRTLPHTVLRRKLVLATLNSMIHPSKFFSWMRL